MSAVRSHSPWCVSLAVLLTLSCGFVIASSATSQQVFVFTLNSSTGALTTAPGSPYPATTPNDLAVVQQ